MTEAAKQARKAYYKKWRAEHKENVRAWNKRYWEKKAAQAAAQEQEPAQDQTEERE